MTVNLLLDTHTLPWFYLDDPKLSRTADALIQDPANRVFVSPASHWEVAIKVGTGKYVLTVPFAQFVQEAIHDNGFAVLPIEPRHSAFLVGLPLHHKDPFDRMLIAQAHVEAMPVVGVDTAFDPYPVRRLW